MKKRILIILASFILSFPLFAQLNQGIFAIGGATNDEDGYSIARSADGSYAMTGYTRSFGAGGYDMYVVKWDSAGNLKWANTIGGTNTDRGYCIAATYDGGYAISGSTMSFGAGAEDVYVVKLDRSGNVKWTKTIGGTGTDVGYGIIQTADSGLAITGFTSSFRVGGDVYVIKLDSAGNLKWTNTIGGKGSNNGYSIIQTTDGGYAIGGSTDTSGNTGRNDMYLVKLNAVGNLMWTKTIGGTLDDVATSIVQTSDGGYAMAGYTNSYGAGGYDCYVVKLDNLGNLNWANTIGGTAVDIASSIVQNADGGYVVAGGTTSFGAGSQDVYLVKLNSGGNLVWTKTLGGPANETAASIVRCPDGGYAIGGWSSSISIGGDDFMFMKIDSLANTCVSGSIGGTMSSGGVLGSGGISGGGGGIVGNGGVQGNGGTATNYCSVLTAIENVAIKNETTIYPNPSKGIFGLGIPNYTAGMNYHVEIYNELGEKVFQGKLNSKTNTIELSNPVSGVYFYRVISSEGELFGMGKFIIE